MKFRSLLLFACLAVVPLVAMFSHKIPRAWRETVQLIARGEGLPAIRPPAAVQSSGTPPATSTSVVAAEHHAAQARMPASARPGPAVAPAAVVPAQVSNAVEDELAALGAVSIACVPLNGGGLHRCSCRMPADASGQLHRVFQASHADSAVAWQHLLAQVRKWRREPHAQPATRTALRGGDRPLPLAQP